MNKMLVSGNCRIGYAGENTNLVDSYGDKLHTGDLVSLSHYDKNNPDRYEDYYGVEFVCNNEFQDDGLDKKKYVMGIASDFCEYEDGDGESIVTQNDKEWRIRKVKGYEKLVNGETWGAVKAIDAE